MPYSFIAAASGSNDGAGTTLDTATSLNLAAGDLVVFICANESGSTTRTIAKDAGSPANNAQIDAADIVNHTDGVLSAAGGYLLAASADAAAKFRLTTQSRDFRRLIAFQFRPADGFVAVKDTSNHSATNASGFTANSGNITTTGADGVAVNGFAEDNGDSLTNEAINGVAATEPAQSPVPGPAGTAACYRILSAAFVGGAGTGDKSTGGNYIDIIMAFKAAAAAASVTATLMGQASL